MYSNNTSPSNLQGAYTSLARAQVELMDEEKKKQYSHVSIVDLSIESHEGRPWLHSPSGEASECKDLQCLVIIFFEWARRRG